MKKLAVVGSSGGNLYKQGGKNPKRMMREIFVQANSAGIEVAFVQFIGTTRYMDNSSMDAKAKLYTLSSKEQLDVSETKPLKEINRMAQEVDKKLAKLVNNGEIDGIILMSCDPKGVNNKALVAAADKKIPVCGTGGASMANTLALGCIVIAASGTTETTNRTRAISAIYAFSKEWDLKYSPVIKSSISKIVECSVWKRINFRGINTKKYSKR